MEPLSADCWYVAGYSERASCKIGLSRCVERSHFK